jgi:hypothetical protein
MFRRTLTIQRASRAERTLLRTGMILRFRDGQTTEEAVDRRQLRGIVRNLFAIELPDTPLVFESYD